MDHSVTFARHYARLLWLLVHEPSNVDEQKASLRALVTISKDGAVTLGSDGPELLANGNLVPGVLAGVADAVRLMRAHGLAEIQFDAGAAAAGVVGSARVLAWEAVQSDGGHAAVSKQEAQGAPSVRFVAVPAPVVAPVVAPVADAAPAAVPVAAAAETSVAAPAIAAAGAAPIEEAATLPDLGFGDVIDEQAMKAKLMPTPRASVTAPAQKESRNEGGMFEQFAAARTPTTSHDELLTQLDQSTTAGVLARVLDDLVLIAEGAARDGKVTLVADILSRITRREPAIQEFEAKRAFVMALRRAAKPALLRAVTQQIPHAGDRREEFVAVLARAGEDGADALIEQIAAVSGQTDRRAYFDVLVQLQAGIPTLIHMLGDARWFVARNAAELLGEMEAKESEPQLTALLRHEDDRVRRAATGALMRLGTTRAMQAIQDALKDGAPAMRMQAAAALLTRKDLKTAATLVKALEDEKDDEVQAAFMLALGKLATPDAVQRLIKAVEAERGLFKKKSTAYRVAAVQGLAEAKTPEAMEVLRALQGDRDDDVKSAVTFALLRIAKQAPIPMRPSA
jgi:HEAT repeat protein